MNFHVYLCLKIMINIMINMVCYDNLTDDQVAALSQDGNGDAFDVLLQRYQNMISIKSHKAAGGALEASDLSQECSIALIKAVKSFNPNCGVSFKTFATTCINNRIISSLRSQKRTETQIADIDALAVEHDNREQALQQREEVKSFINNNLSPIECKVFLQFLQGKTYNEIADTLNIGRKSVDNAIQRIRKKARGLF